MSETRLLLVVIAFLAATLVGMAWIAYNAVDRWKYWRERYMELAETERCATAAQPEGDE